MDDPGKAGNGVLYQIFWFNQQPGRGGTGPTQQRFVASSRRAGKRLGSEKR
jgi:hypothetical protein